MINLQFTQEDITALQHLRFHYPDPRVQKKMEAVFLKSQGVRHSDIARLVGVTDDTVHAYLKQYQQGGIERLKQFNYHRPCSALMEHRHTIADHLQLHPPTSINEAAAIIEALTGIKRSPTQVRQFLNDIGMKCRKVGVLPAKADPDVQEEFKKKELEPRLEEAQQGKRAVFFVDAAHFVFGAFLGWLWCFSRRFVRAPSGRQRFNVLGALNAITHEMVMITNCDYINSHSVCELLHKVADLGLKVPITLVLDNARYQRCALVQELACKLEIELLFLPAYSPNLNLIERFWKYVKKECLYSKYYDSFALFCSSIHRCCETAHLEQKSALDSLLTLRFQTFNKSDFLPV